MKHTNLTCKNEHRSTDVDPLWFEAAIIDELLVRTFFRITTICKGLIQRFEIASKTWCAITSGRFTPYLEKLVKKKDPACVGIPFKEVAGMMDRFPMSPMARFCYSLTCEQV